MILINILFIIIITFAVEDIADFPIWWYALYLNFLMALTMKLRKTLQDDVGFVVLERNGSRHHTIHIGVHACADYICLLAESIDDVECSLHRLETSAAEIGLTINHNKTKEIPLVQASVRHVPFTNGDPVDSCYKFEYL